MAKITKFIYHNSKNYQVDIDNHDGFFIGTIKGTNKGFLSESIPELLEEVREGIKGGVV